jgi:predicted acylesterase/phospholipase RssA
MDLILSSGFLAFARHLGVVEALQRHGIVAEAIVGTSSGALVGALVQAGTPLATIAELMSRAPPLRSLLLHHRPWQGLFSTTGIVRVLERHLPRRFQDLRGSLALGVCDTTGRHELLHEGDLMPALLASMAIPRVFPAVSIGDRRFVDGGVRDRTAVNAWRVWRPSRRAIIHVVARSRGRDVPFDEQNTLVIRTPRTHATFWSLGDFARHQAEARALAEAVLERGFTTVP